MHYNGLWNGAQGARRVANQFVLDWLGKKSLQND